MFVSFRHTPLCVLTNHSADRLRFCKEKVDCCDAMLSHTYSITLQYNHFCANMLDNPEDETFLSYIVKAMDILDQVKSLEDLPLEDLMLLHDVYRNIVMRTHSDGTGNYHWPHCRYFHPEIGPGREGMGDGPKGACLF